MSKIDPSVIDNIRQQSDIVQVIGHYLPLVQRGNSIKCICPFHDDHDPSLSISSSKQIYKCFVCGAAGNVFTFVQNFENLSFLAAVKRVADISHLTFDYQEERIDPRDKLDETTKKYYEVLENSTAYLKYQLKQPEGKEHFDYLINRGIDEELIKRFQIGYQPKGENLSKFLLAKGYDLATLEAVNLVSNNYDVFNNRITFPLINESGYVVGYSARSLLEDQAKYINTATTSIYQKSQLVYNYLQAKPFCQKENQVIVCEGIIDVIAFARVGVNQAVATLGTACTIDQLKKIRQLSSNICICYDGDKAGQNATYKLGKLASLNNIVIKVLDNKTNLDPDDIIKEYSKDELLLLSKRWLTWLEFLYKYLSTNLDLRNYSQKEKFAREMLEEINKCNNPYEQEYALKQLNEATKFNLSLDRKTTTLPSKPHRASKVSTLSGERAQLEIINQMLKGKEAMVVFQRDIGFLPNYNLNRLAMLIIGAYQQGLEVSIATLYSIVEEKELQDYLGILQEFDLLQPDLQIGLLQGAIVNVKSFLIKEKIRSVNEKIKETYDPAIKAELNKEKILLKKQQLDLLKGAEDENERN